MSQTSSSLRFPRLPLIGAFALAGFALVAATFGSLTHAGAPLQSGEVVTERNLVFADRADGAVVVTNAADHRTVEVLEGQNGFLRGTLRGMARTRHAEKIGAAVPFRLAVWSDGRLTLDDPATGRHVELLAFGPTNAEVFAHLLDVGEGKS
jgi:putative photosynthetic complex assembly protein